MDKRQGIAEMVSPGVNEVERKEEEMEEGKVEGMDNGSVKRRKRIIEVEDE